MSEMRHKALDFRVKALDESGSFELTAAGIGNVDRQGELIERGAFKNLPEFVKDGWGAVNHDPMSLPVAMVDEAYQDESGLKLRGRFHSHQAAQDCRTVVRERKEAGKSVKCSIGFKVLEAAPEVRDGRGVFVLKAIELYEFSFVNLPANPEAEVTGVKGVISLDQALGLVRRLKEGRALSRANVATMRAWAKRCRETADEMEALCDQHDKDAPPEVPETEPEGESDDGIKAVKHRELRLRALRLRSDLSTSAR